VNFLQVTSQGHVVYLNIDHIICFGRDPANSEGCYIVHTLSDDPMFVAEPLELLEATLDSFITCPAAHEWKIQR